MLQIVEPECVDELSQVVAPWQLNLRQLSADELQTRIAFTAVNGILISNDRWQGCIHGSGGTSTGYFTIAIPGDNFQIPWIGQALDQDGTLACAASNVEWEFVTLRGTNHRVVLIPQQVQRGCPLGLSTQ